MFEPIIGKCSNLSLSCCL